MLSLEVKNLSKRFKKLVAVNDITFQVEKGTIFAFLGPNGAGKSTSIKMFTTILSPDSGQIKVEGIDISKDKDGARKNFAVVFQDQSLDDELTAYENLKFHAVLYDVKNKEKRMHECLELVALLDRKDDLVKTFSGGMKRRLEIARGLLHHPKILFLDEPTTGLDPQTRNAIWRHIRKLNKELSMTIFFTTHYLPEAEEFADIVCILDNGSIIEEGTVKELTKKTKTKNLEDAYLKLTGTEIRAEKGNSIDSMRNLRRIR